MSGRRNRNSMASSTSRSGRSTSSQPLPSTSRRSTQPHFSTQSLGSQQLNETREIDETDLAESANAVVITALSLAASGKPFKKADLLLGSTAKNRSGIARTITIAKEKLKSVYGLELIEVTNGKYMVAVPKSTPRRGELAARSSAVTLPFTSLLSVVLSLIVLQKGRVAEEYLRNTMLTKLFPDIVVKPHPYFGDVDKLFDEFDQQMYVTKEKESRNGELHTFLKWGLKAKIEFNKKSALPVLGAMFGGSIPQSVLEELEEGDDDVNGSNTEANASTSSN